MTEKSILAMNWTRGTRELETATQLTELEAIAVRVSLAYELQSPKQDEANRRIGNNIEADAFHQLLEFCDNNTAHRNKAADVAEQKRQAAEIAADNEWLGALAYGDADLGTRFTISGGEVMELDAHLEARYEEQNGGDDLPF